MGKYEVRRQKIRDYVRTMVGQLYLSTEPFLDCSWPQEIARKIITEEGYCWTQISKRILSESDETLGRLAMAGRAPNLAESYQSPPPVSMSEVFTDGLLPSHVEDCDGELAVQRLAMAAVVAATADHFWDLVQRRRVQALHHSSYRDELPERQFREPESWSRDGGPGNRGCD